MLPLGLRIQSWVQHSNEYLLWSLTYRTDTETSSRLSGPADVLASTNGPSDWEDDAAPNDCNVVWKEQAAPRVLVQHSEEQVRRLINNNNQLLILFVFRVDELYRFLNSWVAHIYGDLDEEALKLRGFELIQHDTEWANNRTSSKVQRRLKHLHAKCLIANFILGWRWHWWWDWRIHERIMGGELIQMFVIDRFFLKSKEKARRMKIIQEWNEMLF